MKRVLLVPILLVSGYVHADQLDYYVHMDCDPQKGTATLIPSDTFSDKMTMTSVSSEECVFNNGGKIKLKLGIGYSKPFGTGGGTPDKWVSLWVNEAKVLSRESIGCFDGADGGPCSIYFKADESHVEICALSEKYDSNSYEMPDLNKDYRCVKVANRFLSKTKDYFEYPERVVDNKLPVGSNEIFFSADDKLCGKFKSDGPIDKLPEGVKNLTYKSDAIDDGKNSELRELSIDLNNDGITDTVYVSHSRFNPHDGDAYFVLKKSPGIKQDEITLDFLDQNKHFVFPNQWGDCNRQQGCKYNEYYYLTLLAPNPTTLRLPLLRSTRLIATAFKFNKTTYFYIQPTSGYDQRVAAILKPMPDGSAKHICYFRKVEENF